MGLGARDTLRLEAKLPLHGNDIDEETTPFEAGLGFAVKLGKAAEFPGKAELVKQKESGVQRKLVRQLKRGQIKIEEELDLHGMRVREAGVALDRFLSECSERGLRCVRIIHGKGLRSGGSVLKENVDQWLRLRSDVVAFSSAPPNDGGTGAMYVLLKK